MSEKNEGLDNLIALKKSYIATFGSGSGKIVLADLEKRGFVRTTTFSENTMKFAFNEGQRSMHLHIKNMMNLDIERINELNKLNKQRKEEE